MIVKDEAGVIARCLASVRPLLSSWVVVDTGSTDETCELVTRALEGIPGELHRRPWRGFGASRTEALALARGKADYSLVIDADDVLEPAATFTLPHLTHDAYRLRVLDRELAYDRIHLLKNTLPWRYEGVLHEYATCDRPATEAILDGLVYRRRYDGARSSDPEKYSKDAAILESALRDDPSNTRNVFYLAQSYRDAGLIDEAIRVYERRAEMDGWDEEVFYSRLMIARLRERTCGDRAVVWAAYLRAHQTRPSRAESLCDLACYCRTGGEHALAYVFASAAVSIPRPCDALFVEESIYVWRALDEYAAACFFVGRYGDALAANRRLLAEGKLPASEVARVRANLDLSEKGG